MKNSNKKIIGLALELKNGNRSCFEELYKLTYAKAYLTAFRYTNNKYDAEDIVQESYMLLLSGISSLEKIESFVSWFNRIVVNKSKDHLKKKTPVLFNDGDEKEADAMYHGDVDFTIEESVENSELKNVVMKEIDKLVAEKRECIIMKYYEDLTVTQIAEKIGVSVSAVKNRLLNARKDLMKSFMHIGITAA